MNKKAQEFTQMMYIPKLIFLAIVITTILFMVPITLRPNITTWNIESELFAFRTLYSPNGISYYDPLSNKLQPGIIDMSKFNNKTLNKAIYYEDNDRLGAKLKIRDKEIIYNNDVYEEIVKKGIWGGGGVNVLEKSLYILIREDDGTLKPDKLNITIIIPRDRE